MIDLGIKRLSKVLPFLWTLWTIQILLFVLSYMFTGSLLAGNVLFTALVVVMFTEFMVEIFFRMPRISKLDREILDYVFDETQTVKEHILRHGAFEIYRKKYWMVDDIRISKWWVKIDKYRKEYYAIVEDIRPQLEKQFEELPDEQKELMVVPMNKHKGGVEVEVETKTVHVTESENVSK